MAERDHAVARLECVSNIKKRLHELDSSLFRLMYSSDSTVMEASQDLSMRLLNEIETQLERVGLWDQSINIEKNRDRDMMSSPCVTLDGIAAHAKTAKISLRQ